MDYNYLTPGRDYIHSSNFYLYAVEKFPDCNMIECTLRSPIRKKFYLSTKEEGNVGELIIDSHKQYIQLTDEDVTVEKEPSEKQTRILAYQQIAVSTGDVSRLNCPGWWSGTVTWYPKALEPETIIYVKSKILENVRRVCRVQLIVNGELGWTQVMITKK